jgi:multidrug resistance protein MdtO
MAQVAVDRLGRFAPGLAALLEPSPGRLQFAARLALICALTALVAETYQTLDIALTIYIAFFLNQKDRVTSLIYDIAFVILMTVLIALIFLIATVVLDDAMWRVIAIALTSFGLLFLGSASKLKALGGIPAMICAYGLDKLGSAPAGEIGTRALLYVWLFVGIPAGVSIAVNLIAGRPPRRQAEEVIAWRLSLAAAMLGKPDDKVRRQFRDALGQGAAPIESSLHLAGVEHTSSPSDIAALRQAAQSTAVLLSAIDVMDRHPDTRLPGEIRLYIAGLLEEMAGILKKGGYPVNIAWGTPETRLLAPAAAVLDDIRDAILHFAQPSPTAVPAKTHKDKDGFLAKDAFSNPGHVHYALKTTAAAVFCYLLYNQLDWPGIHTCFITCYIVALSTAAETAEKLSLRVLGCMVGAAAGTAAIVYLVPNLVSIGALMLVVFGGGFLSAYVAGGSPRFSYAGFQIAFAFYLCVVQGNAPAFDLAIARDRVVGILIGDLVTFLIFTTLWPVSVARRVDPAIAALLRRLSSLAATPDKETRRGQESQAQAALTAIQTDLQLARYEPSPLLPSQSWLAVRRETIQALMELQSPLFLGANQRAPLPADIPIRLQALADRLQPSAGPERGARLALASAATDPLLALIDRPLDRLDGLLDQIIEHGKEEALYAPA